MDDSIPPQEQPQASTPPPVNPMHSSAVPPVPPPPFLTPPPLAALPVSPRSRTSGVWKVVALVALALLGLCLLTNVSHWFRAFMPGNSRPVYERNTKLEEVYLERKNTSDKIAIVDIEGIITSRDLDRSGMGMVEFVSEQLKTAAKDDDVKAIVLKVNSPGGEVLAADEISRAIIRFQKNTDRPVIASMGSLAASGGYYISAPCRWIVANELTITGSIGVIMHGYNYRGLLDKVGVRPQVFKSGKFKDMLSGDKEPDSDRLPLEERELRAEERKMVQALIDETFNRFKEVVRNGRERAYEINSSKGKALAEDWKDYADGRVFSGKQAAALGFVDELGNLEVAVDRAKQLANIKTASLIQYRQPFDLGSLFSLFGKTEARSIKVDLGFEVPKLQAGYLYYITPLVLQ